MPNSSLERFIDGAKSIEEEAAPYRDMSPEDRARHLAGVSRAAARLLAARNDVRAALEYVDPLPPSTLAALRRLRDIERRRGVA